MLSVLEPTFLLLIVIAHPPMNAFGGTMSENSLPCDFSEAAQKLENRIEMLEKAISEQNQIPHNFIFHGRSQVTNYWKNYDEHFNCFQNCDSEDESCSTATLRNDSKDGVYLLKGSKPDSKPFYVYCQHETESEKLCPFDLKKKGETAWTVIQRRQEGSTSFNRSNWLDFELGFGDLNGEYWIGLERIHQMTSSRPHELLIVLYDYEIGKAYLKYSKFVVGSGEYKLQVGDEKYIPPQPFLFHESRRFLLDDPHSPKSYSCSNLYGGGWWKNDCLESFSRIHGVYCSSSNKERSEEDWRDSLYKVVMAIRPKEV